MKKIKILLVFILLLIPCMVRADMGGPILKPYDMVVVAPEGIDYYYGNETGHLDKDTKITITYEYGQTYNFSIEGSNIIYYLKSLDGLVVLKEEVTPDDLLNEGYSDDPSTHNGIIIKNVTSNNTALIYAADGVDVKKGPSKTYDTIGHLDKDMTVKYSYRLGDPTGITHIYVDSNGVKGWIDILEGNVLLQNTMKYITYKEIQMSCATIPKNTVLSPKYISDKWTHKVLVEYEGCKELVNYFKAVDGLVAMSNINNVANAELDIYEAYGNYGEKIETIPVNANFIIMANATLQGNYEGDYYVSYNGKKGWIRTEWTNIKSDENAPKNEAIEKEITIEETAEEENEEKTTIDEDKVISQNPVDYTSMFVIIGLSVALIAAIIVILVNRKKNTNTDKE